MKVPLNVSYNLVKGKHIAQRKSIVGLCRLLFYERPGVKDRKSIVINVQAEKDKRNIVGNPSEKGQEIDHCKPGSKDRVTNHCMYTKLPRSKDRAYDLRNHSLETGNNKSI